MINIKEVIEIALNVNFTVLRYKVERVEIYGTLITVYYFDNLINDVGNCQFSF